jgi:hypothetical protein
MTVTVYQTFQAGPAIALQNNSDTLILKLRVPSTGNFIIFGRVAVGNTGGSPAQINTRLTTLDGVTMLDNFWVVVAPGTIACASLMGTLSLGSTDENEIVDIRCSTPSGFAQGAMLIAVPVDQISPSL